MNVIIGQEVGFGRWGSMGDLHSTGFGLVTKVNGHGHITVQRIKQTTLEDGTTQLVATEDPPKAFDKFGYQRNTSLPLQLIDVTLLRKELALRKAVQHTNAKVNALITTLKQSFNYSGRAVIDSDSKAKLLAMVNAL